MTWKQMLYSYMFRQTFEVIAGFNLALYQCEEKLNVQHRCLLAVCNPWEFAVCLHAGLFFFFSS